MAMDSSAKVIDGKAIAKQNKDQITTEVSRMREATGVIHGLAVILVGDRKDSATYVRNKKEACESVGINSLEANLAEDSIKEEALNYISGYNDDSLVHGFLVCLRYISRSLTSFSFLRAKYAKVSLISFPI